MIGLLVILLLVLLLPFLAKKVEENLEVFLFVMGGLAAVSGHVLDRALLEKALKDPISITAAVLAAGLLFKWLRKPLEKGIYRLQTGMPFRLFIALVVVISGLLSSVITAIIAALILVLVVSVLPLDRQSEVRLVILACFSIGLGASLTPIGEPLSTIAISKLGGDFFYLLRLIGPEVLGAVLLLGILAMMVVHPAADQASLRDRRTEESYEEIAMRTVKIYLFVMGLTLLGAGFEPLINQYLLQVDTGVLYWMNMVSAILDNATLTAAEISPSMDEPAVKAILLGLLISGGMLVPGNIPNIISAGKLGITSKEWAKFGLPVGLAIMLLCFMVLTFL
ncbi:DUF1646 family protein [Bacillus badius]|uniref:DUF1646 family protein n=1 Tax=Bacillus badius TaxID=1455 RepID=UPI002E1E5EF0|nr:DUF1646 family protein [Bacillus badius]